MGVAGIKRYQLDATHSPHGDDDILDLLLQVGHIGMQLTPLTGTMTKAAQQQAKAARRCNSLPSRGR